jgi:hypothetical protein
VPPHQDLKGSKRQQDGVQSAVEIRGTGHEREGDFI